MMIENKGQKLDDDGEQGQNIDDDRDQRTETR